MNKIKQNDLVKIFLNFESEKNLFNDSVLKVKYWHLIRISVFNQIQEVRFELGEAHTNLRNTSVIKKVLLKFKQIKYFIFNNPLLSFKQKDILLLNHQRRVKENDYYTCLYTDLLIDQINHSNVVLEEPLLEKHLIPTKHNNIVYTDYINFIVAIKKRLFKKRLSFENKQKISDLTNNLNETFNMTFEVEELEQLIYNTAISFKFRVKYYKKILRRIKPKVIIEVVSYGLSRYVINHVSKDLNIPTIELQHGTMGSYHIAYNFKEKINLSTFPDYIFTFGQLWKDNTRLPIKDENIKVVGWPYYENKINYYNSQEQSSNNTKTILFISQGTIGKPLSKMAVELRKLIDANYKIIYKLHPGEYARWKNEYPWLIDSNIKVIDHNNHDMHYYFAESDIQVGVYSTALFEGIGYNLPTFVLPFYGYHYLEDLISKDVVKLVNNVKELNESIINLAFQSNKDNYKKVKEYLWHKNSLDTMLNEINTIIEGQKYDEQD